MPFGWFSRKESSASATMSSKEGKAKLGMKVVLAQQNPEPVYDLADCGALQLPPDTFVMCRLLQKTSLLLKNNCLSDLQKGGQLHELSSLELLDLSQNKLSHLPNTINKLAQLTVLKLSHNRLKSLPSSFGELRNLKELYLSYNKLSKVPPCVCALPNLQVLALDGNNISVLPKEFCNLQKSLCSLEIDSSTLHPPLSELVNESVEAVMQYLCEKHEVEYVGLCESVEEEFAEAVALKQDEANYEEDEFTRDYMERKQKQLKKQIAAEEEMQAKEQQQLAEVLRDVSSNKQHILDELAKTPGELIDYEKQKLRTLQDQYNVEESVRKDQEQQLLVYLAMSDNKDFLIQNLSAQQAELDSEVEGLVNSKENERKRLINDLTEMENDTQAILEELVSAVNSSKNEEFLCMLNAQEEEMTLLLDNIADNSSTLHSNDVVAAMQDALMEEAAIEARRRMFQEEQDARVLAVLEESDLVNSHLEGVMATRMADQEVWVSTLMRDDTVQAEAFKLLLLKNDLKRCDILKQISQVQYELAKLSSLELRKKKYDVKYGSNTMLDQRTTLVEMLKNLLKRKEKREEELDEWFDIVNGKRAEDCQDEEEFWLLQYQRLLEMKPASLAEAEEQLDSRVLEILKDAQVYDLIPVFARNSVTFETLMDLTEEEAASMGVGLATYHSLQRALQNYLEESKLADSKTPSAPHEEDMPYSPSAPDVEEEEAASAPPLLDDDSELTPSAPAFIEVECVVCLNLESEVIFLPCGHMCVCAKCCGPLHLCPLCRAPVISKVLKTF